MPDERTSPAEDAPSARASDDRPFWAREDRDYPEERGSGPGLKRILALATLLGLIGGAVGSATFIRFFADRVPIGRQEIRINESSAIIDVVDKVSPSVVSITARGTTEGPFGFSQPSRGAGTGIIITADGLIITNKHVVPADTSSLSIFTSDGKEYRNAQVISRDPLNDIAFIRIQAKGLRPAEIGNSSSVKVGQRVVAIGNALGQFRNSATAGIISGLGRPVAASSEEGPGGQVEFLEDLFQTDAAINPGNSGGPLVNLAGQVIGINTAVAGQAQNIGFAIPVDQAKGAIASVRERGRIERPYLGVRYINLNRQIAAQLDLPVDSGAYIQGDGGRPGVVPGSPADQAGLQSGDIITKINDRKIDEDTSLASIAGRFKVGEKVTVTYRRGDETRTAELTLAAAPEPGQ